VAPDREPKHPKAAPEWRENIDATLALRLLAAHRGLSNEAAAHIMSGVIERQYAVELLHQLEHSDLPF